MKYYYKVYTYKLGKQLLRLLLGKEKAEQRLEKMRRSAGSADYNAVDGMMRRIFVKVVNEYLETVMPLIKCPVQLIWGAKDSATPLREARVMLRLIPHADLAVIDDAGHYSFLDNPFRFRAIVMAFLKEDIYTKQFIALIVIKIKARKQGIINILNYQQNITFVDTKGEKTTIAAKSKDEEDIAFCVYCPPCCQEIGKWRTSNYTPYYLQQAKEA